MDKHATVTTYAASSGAVFFGFNANEFAAIAGVLIALITFLVNLWFKWQHLRIAREKAAVTEGD